MAVEVPCPKCGAKLKAPENAAGKKVRCKKCDTPFRLPGPSRPGDSTADPQALSVVAPSPLPLDDEDDVPVAAAEPLPPPPPARPAARDVASLPSADPFDFSAPPATKPTAPKPPASPPPAPAPAPTRPAFGAAKSATPAAPAKPAFGAAARPKPVSPPPPSAKKPAPQPPAKKKPEPEPEPLPLDDEEPGPAPKAASAPAPAPADPFAFNLGGDEPKPEKARKKRDRDDEDDDEDRPRSRRRERDREDDDDDDRPRRKGRDRDDEPEEGRRYVRPGARKPGNSLAIAIVLGLFALGAAVAAVIVFTNQRKEDEAKTKKEEKKEEKKDDTGTSPGDPKGGAGDPKTDPKVDPKVDPKKEPPKKEPKVEPAPGVAMMSMHPGIPPLRFQPAGAKLEPAQKPSGEPISVEAAPEKVKRIFAPSDRRKGDLVVVSHDTTAPAGKGERWAVDVYSPNGVRFSRRLIDGDGKEPKCDLSPDGKLFASANPDGKITIYNIAAGEAVLDGFDPYAEYPDRKKEGLAAVFFTAAPGRILTVSTAGYAYLYDIATKKKLEGTSPSGVLAPNKVVLGKNLAADDARASIVMAVNGVIHQIDTEKMTTVGRHSVGEVGRPLGLAVVGVDPGRVVYAFETDDKGKKEKGLLFSVLDKDPKPFAHRWAETPGEPTGAAWAGTKLVAVWSDRGVAYFEADEKRFAPVAFAELAGGKLAHAANEDGHWYLVPDPAKPGQSLLLEMTADSIRDFKNVLDDSDPPTVRLDAQGLSK